MTVEHAHPGTGSDAIERLALLIGAAPGELSTIPPRHAVRLVQRLEEAEEEARRASHDPLTGLWLRRPGEDALERELQRARRSKAPLSILFADIDGLKLVNDTGGHAAGDRILTEVGRVFSGLLRPYDVGVRWGGDEFVIGLVDCDLHRARGIADRVRTELRERGRASVTCGSAEACGDEGLASAVARADSEMYRQKPRR